MKPTEEQKKIVEMATNPDIQRLKINALAGTGKTTTLCMVANKLNCQSLYLAFNKAMAEEARTKFPAHVEVRTTHSLAFQYCGWDIQHKLNRPLGKYQNVCGTGGEIARYFGLPMFEIGERLITSAGVGLAVKETLNKFEYSAEIEIEEKHVSYSVIGKHHMKMLKGKLKKKWVDMVLNTAKELWQMRTDPKSSILATHDTYLKLFQLSKPTMDEYKVIYVDECQDTNNCVMDIFLNQKAKLILVGDTYQSIYAFRGAVNALESLDWPSADLTQSFRFGESIADIGAKVLAASGAKVALKGFGDNSNAYGQEEQEEGESLNEKEQYTILYRTNASLVKDAVDFLDEGKKIKMEMDVRNFTSMLLSAYALERQDKRNVKHEMIAAFSTFYELKREAEETGGEILTVVNMVLQKRAENILARLENYTTPKNPEIILVTAHKSKGLEWKQVVLSDDFPSVYDSKGAWKGLDDQERNLLYMACTRAENILVYNSVVFDILDRSNFKKESEK